MTRTTLLATALAALALPAAAQEHEGTPFMAELTGAAQVPPVETEAMGMADVHVDEAAMMVHWTLSYEGLSGEPVAAHFHGPATPEETAPPTIDLTVDAAGETEGEAVPADIMTGSSEITEEGLQQLRDGLWYINIHTEAHPDGEIRGQVVEGEADATAMEAMGAAASE